MVSLGVLGGLRLSKDATNGLDEILPVKFVDDVTMIAGIMIRVRVLARAPA